jgi:hypothetical protein
VSAETTDSSRSFTADGKTYEYPDPFDLDLDEWVIIYDETGLILEDFAPFDDKKREATRQQQLRNPALIKALAMCGLLRADKELDLDAARELAGDMKMLAVLEALAAGMEEAEEVDPQIGGLPNSESEPDNRSQRKSDDTNENTSADSPASSDVPVEEPAAIGTGG